MPDDSVLDVLNEMTDPERSSASSARRSARAAEEAIKLANAANRTALDANKIGIKGSKTFEFQFTSLRPNPPVERPCKTTLNTDPDEFPRSTQKNADFSG